jgi:hypothetical protein
MNTKQDSGADALGLCGPVEWSEFFEYARRIHKKRIDCEAATKDVENGALFYHQFKTRSFRSVKDGQAIEAIV